LSQKALKTRFWKSCLAVWNTNIMSVISEET